MNYSGLRVRNLADLKAIGDLISKIVQPSQVVAHAMSQ
jgi:hypothetical protein